jgi:outer membrane protein OmpA-like peptidoglycan-associated protein
VKSFPIQAWGEALTELSSLGRDAVTLIAGIRLSLPLSERQNDVVVVSQAAPRRDIRIVLDSRKVFFKTNSARLKPEVLQTLHQVSRHLAENQENWSFIEIAGHADLRGPKDYNDRLSRRRAEAVERAMATADSLDKSRIQLASYGYSRPADPRTTRNAFARNRRVELTFRDVAHPEQLEALLAALSPEPPIAR